MNTFRSLIPLVCIVSGAAMLPAAESTSPQTSGVLTHNGGSDSLESVVDAFLATYAKDNITWKKDIVLTSTPREIPAGRQLGLSTRVGYYTFVPKTWCDLTEKERTDLFADPRLKAFIVSLATPGSYDKRLAVDSPANKPADFDANKSSFPVTGRPIVK